MAEETLSAKAYRSIQSRIYSGALPAGSVVSEVSLAEELGISRTPVREAIRRLCMEGLLEQVPRYGTIVRQQTRRELIELYQLREALEAYAIGEATRRIGGQELAHLESLCERIRAIAHELRDSRRGVLDHDAMGRFLAADMAFHMFLIRAAGNSRISRLVVEARVLTGCFFRTNRRQHDLRIVAGAYRFHRRIFLALKRGDAEAARDLLLRHIRAGLEGALKQYDWLESQATDTQPTRLNLPEDMLTEFTRFDWDGMTKTPGLAAAVPG
jgi:DNA-binding GntR family transcriptional regulator